MFYLYVLKSLEKDYHYIGISSDPARRLEEHNKGYSKSTKPYRPFKIIYLEKHKDKITAAKREYFLKSPKGYQEKLSIIRGHSSIG